VVFSFKKQNLVLSPVIQCCLSRNWSRDILEGSVTGALRETLRRVARRATDKVLAG